MSSSKLSHLQVLEARRRISGSRIGAIVALRQGPIVNFPGNPLGPQAAKVVSSLSAQTISTACEANLPVLLIFENDDPTRPVILDIVMDYPGTARPTGSVPVRDVPQARPIEDGQSPAAGDVRLATIVGVEEGAIMVSDGASVSSPIKARTTIPLRNLKDPVVLLFVEEGLPVIVGQLYSFIPVESDGGEAADVVLKGTRVTIEADVELVLKAGSCVVRLDARGKAVTSADQIVSRARGANKIQGGSVQLN